MLKRRRIKKAGKGNGAELREQISFKDIECERGCGRLVRVDSLTESATCWYCVAISVAPPELRTVPKKDGPKKPKGWHFMKVFVDSEGNVFHEGVEQPTLKGTLPPTPAKAKKTKEQKQLEKEKREAKLVKLHEKKLRLKKKENGTNHNGLGSNNLQEKREEESAHTS